MQVDIATVWVCVYARASVPLYFLVLSAESTWKQWYPRSSEHTQNPDLGSHVPFSSKRSQGSQEKWLGLGLSPRKHKMILKPKVVPESRDVFKQKEKGQACQKDIRVNPEELPVAKVNTGNIGL